ncbi:twin-arginine translocase TatA/TatE family subunit [Saccharibacter sp. 17.LH.SD]|uniref:twin-arginine translocase TatA/TatE family subunit n=1 Tax=Saccharibacter sp. 17.LH.SD TaxID=2689393 RepID=UPI00136BEB44|nr:twin-arginine translocase TatA/TatE family subunit [Saccharibacter sp. 17.LH.SD]MXV45273.1 twin-arginine translocase TatA/TatE family subunit [Saccharibacter sp. 17.LH.SD]
MGSMSITHWIIFGIVVLVLFGGGGKISSLMGDFAKGIKSFKKGMAEDDTPPSPPKPDERLSAPPSGASSTGQQDARMAEEDPAHRPR